MTYLALARHPLDVALSHGANERGEHVVELRIAASGPAEVPDSDAEPPPDDPADYCQQIRTYWEARHAPNVHLFHYADMWVDLDGEMRRVAASLGVRIDEDRWPWFVEAAGLASMRSRAADTAPEAHLGLWVSPEQFFHAGGTRDWKSLLTPEDMSHFGQRMQELAGDAAAWALTGRMA